MLKVVSLLTFLVMLRLSHSAAINGEIFYMQLSRLYVLFVDAIYFVDTNKSPPNVYQSQKKYIRACYYTNWAQWRQAYITFNQLIANYYNLKKIRINPLILLNLTLLSFGGKNKHFQKI
uniref:TPR_REGION domain-containing protein n=1 Tax=Heterorhabditis bacteriophora TaxID=37862 RepID=A0A1I7WHW6_HETBA